MNLTAASGMNTATSVKILNELFSVHAIRTGDTLTVVGAIRSLLNTPLNASLSFSEPNASKIWELLARDPPGVLPFGNFTIGPKQTIPYSTGVVYWYLCISPRLDE